MTVTSQLLISLLGGIIGGFGAKYLWNYYQRPILNVRGIKVRKEIADTNDHRGARYLVEIHNVGKSAATNCRVRLRLDGKFEEMLDTSANEYLGDKEYVATSYESSFNLPWIDEGRPKTMTVNRGEIVELELVTVVSRRNGHEIDTSLIFPTNPDSKNRIGTILKRKWEIDGGPIVESVNQISKEEIEQIPWETMRIEVSGENTTMTRRNLDIIWKQNPLPNISLKQIPTVEA